MNTPQAEIMAEATRLTRAGRLAEATALLQRALGGGAAQPAPSSAPASAPAAPRPTPSGRIFDVDPATGDAVDPALARGTAGVATEPVAAGLRNVLNLLKKPGLRPRHQARRPERIRTPQPLPDGASFTAHSFANEAGRRAYKLYVPARRSEGKVALVVMLHGCTQSPDDFAAGTRMNTLAEEHGFLVAYPGQARAANAQKCWNWFSPGDQRRDRGEPSLLAGISRQVVREHGLDAGRIYVAGLSAGGAAAAIMGLAYPDLYAAVGVHSGLACGAAADVPSAFAAMRQGAAGVPQPPASRTRLVPTIVFHADRDATVHPRNGDQVIAQTMDAAPHGLRRTVERGQVAGGHAYSRTLHLDGEGRAMLEQWLVHGGGHAWSGGSPDGSYTDPQGPDASREMVRFFLGHSLEGGSPLPGAAPG